ncbi:MAG: nodulation protein NfeD [Chloroflexi bacterium]|nr:nodulation protein NfeD [Chloroflexota bacterium]
MKQIRIFLLALTVLAFFSSVHAQSDAPLVVVMTADGPVMPVMEEYIKRGIKNAEQQNAEALVIQLNTPGGDLGSTVEIIQAIRASRVPVVMYITPNGAMAGSAGAIISMAAHVIAMAPEAVIGAASPIDSSGNDLTSTLDKKVKNIIKAQIRPLVTPRGPKALALAEAMIDDAQAATAQEAKQVGLIDFIAKDTDDLLAQLDGFNVETAAGRLTLHTKNPEKSPLNVSFIEQLLFLLTNSNIAFLLLAIGVQAILIEISHPGGWAAGFIGVVCLTLAIYGMGVMTVNWFGFIFFIIAFVLFILDIKAPTHGALTTAGVASFITGALVLFNSPGTPDFQKVSVPLVVGMGIFLGMIFFAILLIAIRAQHAPIQIGAESMPGKTGTVRSFDGDAGQVQLGSELWSAEKAPDSEKIGKGDLVEVVEVRGLRLIIKKK